jgi:ERCC4-type nuclease
MLIRVDMREADLLSLFQINVDGTTHTLRSESLPVGDAILSSDNGETDYIVFERKTLADLAASIRDGRYKEQSLRLQAFPGVPNHNVVYIVEGDFARYNERFSKIGKGALQSAMCSLNYYKGFSVVRTMSIMETYELIQSYANKLAASPAPYGHYHCHHDVHHVVVGEPAQSEEGGAQDSQGGVRGAKARLAKARLVPSRCVPSHCVLDTVGYCSVLKVKQIKCENITPQNIGEIMLCNIPGVSSKTAAAIVKQYPTLRALMEALATSENCLADIRLETQRKLSKQCIHNIYNFLMA